MLQKKGRTAFIIAFLAPAVLLYGAFVVLPFVQALAFSAYRWRGLSSHKTFVGFGNFRQLFEDSIFWQTVRNNLWMLVVGGFLTIALGIGIAHLMKVRSRAGRVLRAVYLFPQMISLVAVAVMWQFIFNPEGLLNGGLRLVGLNSLVHTWLDEAALPSVTVAFIWYAAGFYIMLFSAGLQSIPGEVFEAAELDGSQGWHRFKRITWPLLWSVKRVAVIYIVINVMNTFALVQLMTRGEPDRKSEVMLTYLYEQGFHNYQFGYATALAIGNFVVVMGLTLLILAIYRRNPVEARQ